MLASFLDGYGAVAAPVQGWIDAIAVAPAAQRQGLGSRLLAAAESWLREHSRTSISVGSSLRTFAPGVPVELGSAPFFRRQGYTDTDAAGNPRLAYDVAADLSAYRPPAELREVRGAARPAQRGQEELLYGFLAQGVPRPLVL